MEQANLLIVDSCGERASLALFGGDSLLAEQTLEERTASSTLLGAVRSTLQQRGLALGELSALGVVSGPGSFTGVRVGIALIKGLSEAAALPVAAVSRLAVLAEAAGLQDGFAVLGAGRDQVYLREIGGTADSRERLASWAELTLLAKGREVAVTTPEEQARVQLAGATARLVELRARHGVRSVRSCLADGGSDVAALDANYVRDERAIYASAASTSLAR